MTRHLYLRNNHHLPFCCIFHDFSDIILGIKTAISGFFTGFRRGYLAPWLIFTVHTPGTNTGKFGVFFDFNPPAVIICQMPVKDIHFMHGDQVDVCFNEFFRKEMARDIEMHAPPGKAGLVIYGNSRNIPRYSNHFFRTVNLRW